MGAKLQEHKAKLEKKVNSWDIISAGLGLCGSILLGISFCQPKNPANALRMSVAFVLFGVSVAAEQARESPLMSLNKAIEYENGIKTDKIRKDATRTVILEDTQEDETFFTLFPIDRIPEVAAKLGTTPPNYAARQPDPVLSQVQTAPPPVATVADIPDIDPSADFDPESEQRKLSGSMFIPKERVEEWFKSLEGSIPESLIEEWKQSKGAIGIEVNDGSARIIGGQTE